MNKKLMEILRELRCSQNKHITGDVDQAHDQIIELWKKCLLEKGEPLYTDDMDAYQQGFALGVAQGHNQAITQAQKNMEG